MIRQKKPTTPKFFIPTSNQTNSQLSKAKDLSHNNLPNFIHDEHCVSFQRLFSKMLKKRQCYFFQLLKQFVLFSDAESEIIPNYKFMRSEVQKANAIMQTIIKKCLIRKKLESFITIKLYKKPKLQAYYETQNIQFLVQKVSKLSSKEKKLVYKIVMRFLNRNMKQQQKKQRLKMLSEEQQGNQNTIQQINCLRVTPQIKKDHKQADSGNPNVSRSSFSRSQHSQRKSSNSRKLKWLDSQSKTKRTNFSTSRNTPIIEQTVKNPSKSFILRTKTDQNTEISDEQSTFLQKLSVKMSKSKILSRLSSQAQFSNKAEKISTCENLKNEQRQSTELNQITNQVNVRKNIRVSEAQALKQEKRCIQFMAENQSVFSLGTINEQNKKSIVNQTIQPKQIKNHLSVQNNQNNQSQKRKSWLAPQRIYIIRDSPCKSIEEKSEKSKQSRVPDQIIKIPIESDNINIVEIITGKKSRIVQPQDCMPDSNKKRILNIMENYYSDLNRHQNQFKIFERQDKQNSREKFQLNNSAKKSPKKKSLVTNKQQNFKLKLNIIPAQHANNNKTQPKFSGNRYQQLKSFEKQLQERQRALTSRQIKINQMERLNISTIRQSSVKAGSIVKYTSLPKKYRQDRQNSINQFKQRKLNSRISQVKFPHFISAQSYPDRDSLQYSFTNVSNGKQQNDNMFQHSFNQNADCLGCKYCKIMQQIRCSSFFNKRR